MVCSISVAGRVVRRYCQVLGVPPIRRVPLAVFRQMQPSIELHPTMHGFGYVPKQYVIRAKHFGDIAKYLPHEVTHIVWPMTAEELGDSEGEWTSGMIHFELAWLDRLCRTPNERAWFGQWSDYSEEGKPFKIGEHGGLCIGDDGALVIDEELLGLQLEEAKRVVRDYKLPDPWGA